MLLRIGALFVVHVAAGHVSASSLPCVAGVGSRCFGSVHELLCARAMHPSINPRHLILASGVFIDETVLLLQVHLHVEKHHVEDIAGDGKAWLDATW